MQRVLGSSMTFLALCALQFVALAQGMDPLQKTVELLTSLQKQVTADGERSQEVYEAYARWCKNTSDSKIAEVKEFEEQKAKLQSDIQLATSDIEASTTKIEQLGKEVSGNQQKKTDLQDAREAEKGSFEMSEKELMDTIDMLGKAIEILEKEAQGSGASLIQATFNTASLDNLLVGLGAVIDAQGTAGRESNSSLSNSSGSDGNQLPPAQKYQGNSETIVEVMEDMRDKAEEQLRLLREGEANSKANYELIHKSLEDQIAQAEKDMKQEKLDKTASEGAKASAEGDLSVAVDELKVTQKSLKTTQDSCLRTAADHETSIAGRKAELAVLAKAKKIIQASMLQQSTSFVQLSSKSTARAKAAASAKVQKHVHVSLISRQVVTMVKQLAAQQKSTALGQLALRLNTVVRFGMSTGKDPFSKVKELIVEMVRRLESELSAEAKEKEYCDSELKKTKEQRQELKDVLGSLRARTAQSEAKSAALKSEVTDLQRELGNLAKEQAELDRVRKVTHEAFVMATADLRKSLDSTRQAIKILRDYYANNDEDGGSAALLQSDDSFSAEMQAPEPPEKFEKSSGAGASIIGILEVSESDLAKNLAEEETEDQGKQTEYEKLKDQNNILKVQKEKDVQYKTAEFKALDKSVADFASDFDTESEELEAVEEYLTKVKERCIAKPESFQTRKERREAEIRGLREALNILESDGDAASLLQRGHTHLRGTVVVEF